ncbi:FtsX-like permease family protein [Nocardioides sp. SYSU DS0663]|uniref:FtsX-like permease family protein n=1 Tax=Nocardioides sp. SYSU DS0663 TaxID=3416445 RepID=UPI003F4C1BD3
MRTVLLASLRTHTRRYVAATVAVVVGVAFVVVTAALASSARNGMVAGVELPYRGADAVVDQLDGATAQELVGDAADRGERAAVLGWTLQQTRVEGRLLPERIDVGPLADSPQLRWQRLEEGRFPRSPAEAVADVNAAKGDGIAVGDEVVVGTGSDTAEATVVGLVDTPSASVAASLYLPWPALDPFLDELFVDSVAYAGASADVLQHRLGSDGRAQPRDAFVEERQTQLTQEVDVVTILLLLFAAIALFVATLVIANTFSILFAQRARDFALLRCVGASRGQVRRSVRVEALVLGAAASTLGLLVGAAIGAGLVALARGRVDVMGLATPSPLWYVAAFGTGLLVTLVAAWLPTRRVTSVDPLAALRPHDVDVRTRAGRLRVALGCAVLAVGVGLLALAVASHEVVPMLAGGMAAFSGVLLLGPVLVPAAVQAAGGLAGLVAGRLPGGGGGPAVRLATSNAVRNPRRTAATTASLLVGVTLTTAVLAGLASSRDSVEAEMDAQYPIDLALVAGEGALPADLLADVRATSGVAAAVVASGVDARLSDGVGRIPVVAAPADTAQAVHGSPEVASPEPGEIWVPWDLVPDRTDGARVEVAVGGRTKVLRLRGGEGWGEVAVVAPAVLARLGEEPKPRAVWVRADDDADAEDLAGDLDAVATDAGADLVNTLGERSWVHVQLDVLTATVAALLGIAVVIALVGIGNTLGLSVLERGRENALLRALGLTRRQLSGTLAAEALLLSVVATVLGTAIGVSFAWVAVQTLVTSAVPGAALVLPWGQLALVVLLAGVAGLASCVLPARRAARTAPAAGLTLD